MTGYQPTPRILQADLTKVYVDPLTPPLSERAYIPEVHASVNCVRALRGGRTLEKHYLRGDPIWCETCTTTDPSKATMRRTKTGWERIPDE